MAPKIFYKKKKLRKKSCSTYKFGVWKIHSQKLQMYVTLVRKVVQSSITTLKWSEDSHYGVRIMVSKSPDLPFSSYGPRPFFGPAISAEKLRNSNFTQFTYVRCRFLCLLIPGIDCNCLFKEIIKENDILAFWKKNWYNLDDFQVSRYPKIDRFTR